MKKLFVIFLSLFYLVVASGFTQYSHLCKGAATKIFSLTNTQKNQDEPCPVCISKEKDLKDKKKDCCKHDSKLVKVNDTVKKQFNFDFSVKFWGDSIPNKMLGSVFDFSTLAFKTEKNSSYHSSKARIQSNPLYILHCVYRI